MIRFKIALVSVIGMSMIISIAVLWNAHLSIFGQSHILGSTDQIYNKMQNYSGSKNLFQNKELNEPKIHYYDTASKNNLPSTRYLRMNNEESSVISLESNPRSIISSCNMNLKCEINNSTGWNDKTSIQISTNNTENENLRIIGQEVDVKAKERYQIVIHMKLNEWARQARVDFDGFNVSSQQWYHIDQCPSANVNGPTEWQEFSCGISLDSNTIKLRPILNTGAASHMKKEASTWFDSIYLVKFKQHLTDQNLIAEIAYQGLNSPVSMAFLGQNDFLVIERHGTVERIVNGVKLTKPLLNLNLTRDGLIGIAINNNRSDEKTFVGEPIQVYLYFGTYKQKQDESIQNKELVANALYRYELINNTLSNPKLLLEVPAGYNHNGGPILISPDKQSVYVSVGDAENETFQVLASKALNNKTGLEPDGTGGILHLTQDGHPVHSSVFDTKYPLNLYYAYGIRQSFGMDFDPLTGKLWDTENGANWGDEINLVEPGFNSGWIKVQGVWKDHVRDNGFNDTDVTYSPKGLVDFDGRGKYRSPEFIWKYTVGPTALKFVSTDKLGKKYENNIFVADANNGRIYNFKLNENRTGLLLTGALSDKIADTDDELDNVIFAGGFGIITDLKIGPDGYLYFVAYSEGKIYRVVPRS